MSHIANLSMVYTIAGSSVSSLVIIKITHHTLKFLFGIAAFSHRSYSPPRYSPTSVGGSRKRNLSSKILYKLRLFIFFQIINNVKL